MKDWKGTKGRMEIMAYDDEVIELYQDNQPCLDVVRNVNRTDKDEIYINAKLFCDSINTIQKCGLLPSELLDQRNKLFKFVVDVIEQENLSQSAFDEANELINKIQNG